MLSRFQTRLLKENWEVLFEALAKKQEIDVNGISASDSYLSDNEKLNRYINVRPFNKNRIQIVSPNGNRNYINASLINSSVKKYILMQGPLSETVGDVWQMIHQENISTVVMLCKVQEKDGEKCAQYWPEADNHISHNSLEIRLKSTDGFLNYKLRTLELTDLNSSSPPRAIRQYHYTTWPDFGVTKPADFLKFLTDVNDSEESDGSPVLIHCSAGLGRSGCYMLVDWALTNFKIREILDYDDVLDALRKFRKERKGVIQTWQQLEFSFNAILEGAKKMDKEGGNKESSESSDTGSGKKRSTSEHPSSQTRKRNRTSENNSEAC